ncbi:MAG: tRNA uridine-5-carboxymethylaminomethyl(34) synthesis GTPase MnmE [Elusimicrobia bacterium RIFCSPHIGHO2_02_FULL_57_9]|nr:MAG: tRNA uridine-5-carboxymethylaminomethyl(34) synthesis GTPase MnmE [Elusimicrobia bacterium RIFCSPHIGHO2_02_FULL_57_9]
MKGETIAAVATASGCAALGIVRLSGEQALPIALSFLQPKAPLKARSATLAKAHWETPIDEVLATYFPASQSPTGEDLVEVSAHGSPLILKRLLMAALAAGARPARPGEFTQRRFLNGRLDLTQAEAVCDLIRAKTSEAQRAALVQLEGGLSKEIAALRAPLLDLLIRIEANLDHPEEDIPSLSVAEIRQSLAQAAAPLLNLAATFDRGRRLAEGARICIVGRPNAGKSSLLNALLGTDRAIVCASAGTTRDTLEEGADIGGIPSLLIDTAGLREHCGDEVERSGVERAQRALRACDLALLVIDQSKTLEAEDESVHRRILEQAAQQGRPVISVLNKADLPCRNATRGDVSISAKAKTGLQDLLGLIGRRLAPAQLSEGSLITSVRHHQALRGAVQELEQARAAAARWPALWEDRAACHLRQALRRLGEITGEAAPDEILEGIFSRFCVGK